MMIRWTSISRTFGIEVKLDLFFAGRNCRDCCKIVLKEKTACREEVCNSALYGGSKEG
jgi:hypothetical protein